MECMVKVVKPFYAMKCIVGWLAGILCWGEGCNGCKMCYQDGASGPLMGLRSPHLC